MVSQAAGFRDIDGECLDLFQWLQGDAVGRKRSEVAGLATDRRKSKHLAGTVDVGAAHVEYLVAKPVKRSLSNQLACSPEERELRAEPVALDARRRARPVRRRLTGVMSSKAGSNPCVLSDTRFVRLL